MCSVFHSSGELTLMPGSPCTSCIIYIYICIYYIYPSRSDSAEAKADSSTSAPLRVNKASFFGVFFSHKGSGRGQISLMGCFFFPCLCRPPGGAPAGDLGRARTFWRTAWKPFLKGPMFITCRLVLYQLPVGRVFWGGGGLWWSQESTFGGGHAPGSMFGVR